MKCGECGKQLRWRDILNPFKKSYKLNVTENGKVTEKFRICDECGKFYESIKMLIDVYGEKEVIKMIDEARN